LWERARLKIPPKAGVRGNQVEDNEFFYFCNNCDGDSKQLVLSVVEGLVVSVAEP